MTHKQQLVIEMTVNRVSNSPSHGAAWRAGLLLLTHVLVADFPGKRQVKYHWLGGRQ